MKTKIQSVPKNFVPAMSDRQFLLAMRVSVVLMTIATSVLALNSNASIYEMVGNASKVTLVAAVVTLFAGLFWKRATTQGALFAIGFGLVSWVSLELTCQETDFWPQLVGSLIPQFSRDRGQSVQGITASASASASANG